jgi:hypothetical protein
MDCPQCKESSQVLRLEDFWRSLSQDAELKRDLAQPPKYVARWLIPAGLLAFSVLAFTSDSVLLGLLCVVAGLGSAGWMRMAYVAAEEARARWKRLMYCRHCPHLFEP